MRLIQVKQAEPNKATAMDQLEKDLARLYYTGQFDDYARRISDVPGI